MSTQQLETLTVLLERAEAERDDALRQMREAQERLEAARAQHGQLVQYRDEYTKRWTKTFARPTSVNILGCYQNFGLRLDEAIEQQAGVSHQAERRVELARKLLLEREMRVASVRKLLERRRTDMNRRVMRQEQKATDEQAARTALNRLSPLLHPSL
ncbi:MAG: flagellar export protein FliJ [Burkholderiaceae bacterium]|nr:flagellar export protein FliJ [Burkholderiaceae bacterium]